MASGGNEHLTTEQVTYLLSIVSENNAIVIGGQSVNIWAGYYSDRSPALSGYGPFTSKDIDFYRNREAAERLADVLDGELFIPELGNETPNAAVVVGSLNGRRIEIDFLRVVLGVSDKSLTENYVVLLGSDPTTGNEIRILLMHPLDCVRSRLANINILGRHGQLSISQGYASIEVLRLFLDDMLAQGEFQKVQKCLRDLEHLGRTVWAGTPAHLRHGLDILPLMRGFLDRDELDHRWRTLTLSKAIGRLELRVAACGSR